MSSRSKRRAVANETVEICDRVAYINSGGVVVDIAHSVASAIQRTKHYRSDQAKSLFERRDKQLRQHRFESTEIILRNCTTLEAASALAADSASGHLVCLNFASAKNPGGGFLNGSQAQEESLARASALRACIFPCMPHYEEGRNCGNCFYTDSMLFSPNVPVFRNDADELLDQPYQVSFLTSAAVNAGAVRRGDSNPDEKIESVMLARTEKMLSVAIVEQCETLVLGARGLWRLQKRPRQHRGMVSSFPRR